MLISIKMKKKKPVKNIISTSDVVFSLAALNRVNGILASLYWRIDKQHLPRHLNTSINKVKVLSFGKVKLKLFYYRLPHLNICKKPAAV